MKKRRFFIIENEHEVAALVAALGTPGATCPICGDGPFAGIQNHACKVHKSLWEQVKLARTCSVEGCVTPQAQNGLCSLHMSRLFRHGDVHVNKNPQRYKLTERDELGRKQCWTCERWLNTSEFRGGVATLDGLHGSCARCQRAKHRQSYSPPPKHYYDRRRARDKDGLKECTSCETWLPEGDFKADGRRIDGLCAICKLCTRRKRRESWLRTKYGLTPEAYQKLLADQNGQCAICATAIHGDEATHVDHDHACCPSSVQSCGRCVRGLLCRRCNTGLGMFGDAPENLRAAFDYLAGNLAH